MRALLGGLLGQRLPLGGVAQRIVAQQILDGVHIEGIGQRLGGLDPEHMVQTVTQCRHAYSTPICTRSTGWPPA